jgi:membrane protease YdiL (CAAX protease family)
MRTLTAESETVPQFIRPQGLIYAAIGVLVALGWPFVWRLFSGASGSHLMSVRGDLRTIAVEWTVVAVLALVAFQLQRLSPAFFRLRRFNWRDILFTLAALVVALALSGIVSQKVSAPKFDLRQLAAVPLAVRLALVVTAAVCEEFMYRGFAIEELGLLTGNRWLGALGSLVLFGLGHVGTYGFSSALLIPASVGLVITLLYMFRNNLVLCMLVHCAIDALMVIVVPALLSK